MTDRCKKCIWKKDWLDAFSNCLAAGKNRAIPPLLPTLSFICERAHAHGGRGRGGGCRHARSSLANTGRLAAGISDRYSAKSAGRRGEPHSYTYLYGWSIARSRLWALSMHSWIRPSILIPTKFTPLISTLFRIVDRRSRNTSNMFLFIFSLIFFILICS